jgi:transposase
VTPWSEADRVKNDVIRERYSSDLSDAEFALIFPLPSARRRRGRKPTCAHEIWNAPLYLIRSGCPCRLLPKDFPRLRGRLPGHRALGVEILAQTARSKPASQNHLPEIIKAVKFKHGIEDAREFPPPDPCLDSNANLPP